MPDGWPVPTKTSADGWPTRQLPVAAPPLPLGGTLGPQAGAEPALPSPMIIRFGRAVRACRQRPSVGATVAVAALVTMTHLRASSSKLSEAWGVDVQDQNGKVVWCEVFTT